MQTLYHPRAGGDGGAGGGEPAGSEHHAEVGPTLLFRSLAALQWQVCPPPSPSSTGFGVNPALLTPAAVQPAPLQAPIRRGAPCLGREATPQDQAGQVSTADTQWGVVGVMPSVGFPLSCLRVPGVPAVNGLKFKKAECQFCTWVTTTPCIPTRQSDGRERWGWVRWDLAIVETFSDLPDFMMRSSQTGMHNTGGREALSSSVPSSPSPSLAGG